MKCLDLAADFFSEFLLLAHIVLNLLPVIQVVANYRIYVGQAKSVIGIHDGLRRVAVEVTSHHSLQGNAGIANADRPVFDNSER